MEWEVIEDRQHSGHWRVEAINRDGDGEVYVTVFSGPRSEERAREYASWKMGMGRAAA
jgi:hypothetical protein